MTRRLEDSFLELEMALDAEPLPQKDRDNSRELLNKVRADVIAAETRKAQTPDHMKRLILFILAVLINAVLAPMALAAFDPGKATAPEVRDLKVWAPPLTGGTLENYVAGDFVSSSGPTNKSVNPPQINQGKGLNLRPQKNAAGTITISNCKFANIGTITLPAGKPHTDGIFFTTDETTGNLTVLIQDVLIAGIDGEGIHFDGGKLKKYWIRSTSVGSADGNRITIKLKTACPILNVTIEDTDANVYIDASHVAIADIPELLPSFNVSGLAGQILVTTFDGAKYSNVTPDKVGLKISGIAHQVEAPTVATASLQVDSLWFRKIDGTFVPVGVSSPAGVGVLYPADKFTYHFDTSHLPTAAVDPRDAIITSLKADIDQQAALLATSKARAVKTITYSDGTTVEVKP